MNFPDVRLYRAEDHPRMPWRNGGGTTQEVACNPGGHTASFDWRLSLADVAQDGGFSAFGGFQRIITVLEGRGRWARARHMRFRAMRRWTAACWTARSATST